jgi:hypothetical protein
MIITAAATEQARAAVRIASVLSLETAHMSVVLHANAWTVTLLGHDHFLSGRLQSNVDLASYHLAACAIDNGCVCSG